MKTIVNIKTEEKTITFSAIPQPSEYLRQTIAEAERELAENKAAGPFSSIAELRADLES